MKKLRLGSRVRVISCQDAKELIGRVGILRHLDEGDPQTGAAIFGVEFKGWEEGHRLSRSILIDYDGWYLTRKDLRFVPKRKKKVKK